MRFASRFAKYSHGVRGERTELIGHDPTGRSITRATVRGLDAKFVEARFVLNESEIQQAIKGMIHMGLPIDRDTEEHFSPRSRISGFDSYAAQEQNGWTDEERELVEQALLNSPHLGSDHILLTKDPAKIPWPSYDSDDLETILLVASKGHLVEQVLEYERENANRPEIFELFAEKAEPELVVDAS